MNEPSNSTKGHRLDQQAVLASDPALGLRDNDGLTVLHHAAAERNYETLTRCIKAKAPLTLRDDAGRTPLFTAVINSCLPEADRLLAAELAEAAADVPGGQYALFIFRSLDGHGGNLMHCAATSGSVEAVDWVWENDPDPLCDFTIKDRHGCRPLHLAAESDKPDAAQVVSRLLHRASDREEQEGNKNYVAAAVWGRNEIEGASPLFAAAANGRASICTVLLNWGADVNTTNKAGKPALSAAIEAGDPETVKVLLDAGAHIVNPGMRSNYMPKVVAGRFLEKAKSPESVETASQLISLLEEASLKPRPKQRPAVPAAPEPGG